VPTLSPIFAAPVCGADLDLQIKPQNSRVLGVSGGIFILISFQDESLPRFGGVFLSGRLNQLPRPELLWCGSLGVGSSYYPKAQSKARID
jgi:hypothetical protein